MQLPQFGQLLWLVRWHRTATDELRSNDRTLAECSAVPLSAIVLGWFAPRSRPGIEARTIEAGGEICS